MIATIRNITLAAGALGAAGVSTFVVTNSDDADPAGIVMNAETDGFELCLKTKISYFQNVDAGCYARPQLLSLRDATLVDLSNDPIMFEMAHPTDMTRAPEPCRTCREYAEMQFDGWYAMSSRDMRREAFFVRACGMLDMLLDATRAELSYFADAGLSADDMAVIGAREVVQIGEAADETTDETGDVDVAIAGPNQWRMESNGQSMVLEEIAEADFDNDGVAEKLVFLNTRPSDGATARVSSLVLLEKDSAETEIKLTPLTFNDSPDGASGAL